MIGKLTNAAGGFWDSLDSQERLIAAYVGAVVMMWLFSATRSAARERLKAELREEIRGGVR